MKLVHIKLIMCTDNEISAHKVNSWVSRNLNHIIYLFLPSRRLKTLQVPTLLVFTGAC